MKPAILTVILLIIANVFMTLAWYGHLKLQGAGISTNWPLYVVVLLSWGIAIFARSLPTVWVLKGTAARIRSSSSRLCRRLYRLSCSPF